jgi:cytochrome c oxidase cbb3-type subunit III
MNHVNSADFYSATWGWYIAIVTVLSILGVLIFLRAQNKRRVNPAQESDDTGHVWDESLRELNNPMPRWWLGMFYIGIVFGGVYLVLYPGLGHLPGQLQSSNYQEYEAERNAVDANAKPLYTRYAKIPVEELATNLSAREMGQRLFLNHCATCHGSDAGGAKGFPNLTDEDWLYGGTPEAISTTIREGRNGVMPPFEALGEEKVRDAVHYVRSLSGLSFDTTRKQRGQTTFSTICAACHGTNGKGMQAHPI